MSVKSKGEFEMKKRTISIILILTLVLITLTGCNTAEMNYLNMSKELTSNKGSAIKGGIEIKLEYNDIINYINSKLDDDIYDYQKYLFNETATYLKKYDKIKLNYEGEVDNSKSGAYSLNADVTIGQQNFKLGNLLYDYEKGLFVPKDYIIGIFKIINMFEINEKGKEVNEKIIKEVEKNTANIDYFFFDNKVDNNELLPFYMSAVNDDITVFGQPEIDFISEAFKNFSTGIITQSGGNLKISTDLNELFKMIYRALDYTINNLDEIIVAIEKYINSDSLIVKVLMNKKANDEELLNSLMYDNPFADYDLELIKESNAFECEESNDYGILGYLKDESNKKELKMELIQAKAEIEKLMIDELFEDFKNSSYNATISTANGKLQSSEEYKIIVQGKTLATVNTLENCTPKDVKIDILKGVISDIDKAFDIADKAVAKINPISKVCLTWHLDDEDVIIDYLREEEALLCENNFYDFETYKMRDKNIYVPIRNIAENLGKEVYWDNGAKKAYALMDGKKIVLDGFLDYDDYSESYVSFVKLREFEKLGYSIEYSFDKEYKEHTAVLIKN